MKKTPQVTSLYKHTLKEDHGIELRNFCDDERKAHVAKHIYTILCFINLSSLNSFFSDSSGLSSIPKKPPSLEKSAVAAWRRIKKCHPKSSALTHHILHSAPQQQQQTKPKKTTVHNHKEPLKRNFKKRKKNSPHLCILQGVCCKWFIISSAPLPHIWVASFWGGHPQKVWRLTWGTV